MSEALKAALELMTDFDIFDWSEFVTKFDINMSIQDIAKIMQGGEPEVKYIKKLVIPYRLMVVRMPVSSEQHPKVIQAIKVVREVTNWGLKQAKDFIDNTNDFMPKEIMQGTLEDMDAALETIAQTNTYGFQFYTEEVPQ